MDTVRSLVVAASSGALQTADSDSGIDASCCNTVSGTLNSSQSVTPAEIGIGSSNSDAPSVAHDLSADADANDDAANDDSLCTENDSVSGVDGDLDCGISSEHTDDPDPDATDGVDVDDDQPLAVFHMNVRQAHELATVGDATTATTMTLDNNRLFQQRLQLRERGRMASKEEKQRQNEEIVIMESSSVSSETGSWESVFPQRTPTVSGADATIGSASTNQTQAPLLPPHSPPPPPSKCTDIRLPDFQFTSKSSATTATSACFIDASSLMDDTELCASNETLGPQLPSVGCRGPKPDADSSSSAPTDLHSPNLSDEQKLLHRVGPNDVQSPQLVSQSTADGGAYADIKDQFASGPSIASSLVSVDVTTAAAGSSSDISISTAESAAELQQRHRQDLERKQGHFLFCNSIQHFSGHVLNPIARIGGVGFHRDEQRTDDVMSSEISLPSMYSTGSADLATPASLDTFVAAPYSQPESGFYPDTPHNSIMHIEHVAPVPIASTVSAASDGDRRKEGRTEGPAEITTVYQRPFDSPSVRRKTETCPILSGGLQTEDLQDESTTAVRSLRDSSLSSSLNSWVVDMSDCRSPKQDRLRMDAVHSLDTRSSGTSGARFFVDISDGDGASSLPPNMSTVAGPQQRRHGEATVGGETTATAEKKNIFSMFIDFGDKKPVARRDPTSFTSRLSMSMLRQHSEGSAAVSADTSETADVSAKQTPVVVRRNLPATRPRNADPHNRYSWNEPKSKRTPSAPHRRIEYTSSLSMPNGSESHGHSDSGSGIMSILDKIPFISKTSSMVADSPQSPFDDLTSASCTKSMSLYSNNSDRSGMLSSTEEARLAGQPNADGIAQAPLRKRRQDVEINETFDKSSRSSLPEEHLSTDDTSPITDTDDVTFQNELDEDPLLDMMLLQTAAAETDQPASATIMQPAESTVGPSHTMESLQAIMERQQKLLLETVTEEPTNTTAFVKLSDMDKPALKFELHSAEAAADLSKSIGMATSRIERLFGDGCRLPRSVVGRSAIHPMSRSTGNNNLTTLASSSDNLKSLTRLFPHLSKELSNSMPADMQMEAADTTAALAVATQKSPVYNGGGAGDCAETNDISAASSVTSSFSRSAIDSADESSLSYRQPRRLGEDLLKMFLQEIATDVQLEVAGRRMPAHKCILRSRCQYFAAILAGPWVHAAGNVIQLPGYSYGAVHFALCHIYSGAAHPPEGISLIELAALADLLGLEGLKEVTAYALRTHYCHNFHKPCTGCIDGILQVFPVTLNHGLDDLYRKCLRWTCRHYVKVWPTRAFSQLPADIVARCAQHLVAHMNSENVLDMILDCDQLLTLIAPCRWAIAIENTIRDIIDSAHAYLADHFASLLASDAFLSLGQGHSWNISRLEHLLLRTATQLTPEQACRSYQRVTRLNAVLHASAASSGSQTTTLMGDRVDLLVLPGGSGGSRGGGGEEIEWNAEFLRLVDDVLNAVQHCLTNQCGRAMRTGQWQRMNADLRLNIQKLACLAEPPDRRPSQMTKPMVYQSLSSGSVPNALLSAGGTNRNHDLHAVKLAIQAQTKRAQESLRARVEHRAASHSLPPPAAAVHHQQPPPERPSSLHLRSTASSHLHHAQHNNTHSRHSSTHESRPTERPSVGPVARTRPQSSSFAPVPDLIPISATKSHPSAKSECPPVALNTSVAGHRRTQSESNNVLTRLGNVVDIQPRYLEPRSKRIGTSAGIGRDQTRAPAIDLHKGDRANLSSSDSSASKPRHAINKRLTGSVPPNRPNLSRDSLMSSPGMSGHNTAPYIHNGGGAAVSARTTAAALTNVADAAGSEVDLSVDSLGGSMHSSIRSNKSSASQESLHAYNASVRANNAAKTAKALQQQQQQKLAALKQTEFKSSASVSRLRKPTSFAIALTGGTSTNPLAAGRTLATIASKMSPVSLRSSTAKSSSRLSSSNSATSSPRDAVAAASSGGTNSTDGTESARSTGPFNRLSVERRSFLSARSKDILAAKHKSTGISSNGTTTTAACFRTSSAGNQQGSTSAVVQQPAAKQRPVSFPTTLHLRRTAKLASPLQPVTTSSALRSTSNRAVSASPRSPSSYGKFARPDPKRDSMTRGHVQHRLQRTNNNAANASASRQAVVARKSPATHADDDDNDECFVAPRAAGRVESKLERSSTFCKETPTLDVSALQVID